MNTVLKVGSDLKNRVEQLLYVILMQPNTAFAYLFIFSDIR